MMSEQLHHLGPPLDVKSWITRGSSGSRLTDKGATGGIAHLEINHNPDAQERWIKDYVSGRDEFRDSYVENARQFAMSDKPAEAIVSSRLALEPPSRAMYFMFNQDLVVKALGMGDSADILFKRVTKRGEVDASLRTSIRAMSVAFGTPDDVKAGLNGIIDQSREAIKDGEVQAWSEAVSYFGESGELFAAGVGALELGAAHEQQCQTDEALDAYVAAGELLKRHLDDVTSRGDSTKHTAELDELRNHLIVASDATIRLYAAKGSVRGEDREVVKAAVYLLDDLRAPADTVQKGYEFLASNTHLKERRFYKKEALAIAGSIAVSRFFRENPGAILGGGPKPRQDWRRRPPIIAK